MRWLPVSSFLASVVIIGCGAAGSPVSRAEPTKPSAAAVDNTAAIQIAVEGTVRAAVPVAVEATVRAMPTATAVPPTATPVPPSPTRVMATATASSQPLRTVYQGQRLGKSGVQYAFIVENPNPDLMALEAPYRITAYAKDGTVIATHAGSVDMVYPVSKTGTYGTVSLPSNAVVEKVDLQISPAKRFERAEHTAPFTVENQAYVPDRFFPKITGVMKNPLPRAVKWIRVSAVAQAADGTFLGGGFAFADEAPPNGSIPVQMSAEIEGGNPAKLEVFASPSSLSNLR